MPKRNYTFLSLLVFYAIFCFGAATPACASGDVSVKSGVDKIRVLIGEPVTYTLTLSRKESVSLDMPALGAHLGSFDIRDYTVAKPEKQNGMVVEKYVYVIASFQLGKSEIPAFTIKYKTGSGKEKSISAEKIVIDVVPTPSEEIKDIIKLKPPMEKTFAWGAIKHTLLVTLLIIVFAVLGVFLYKFLKNKTPKENGEAEPEQTPEEWAFTFISKLEDSDMIEQERVKDYYDFLSDLIRKFFEKLYAIELMELTTSELEHRLSPFFSEKPELKDKLTSFLTDCDMVKFADIRPEKTENAEISARARGIVHLASAHEIAITEQ